MKKLAVLIVIFVLLFSLIPTGSVAFADERVYSDVLEDLQKDENFEVANYPIDNTDFGLYVFQITESTDKELLIYVYQPCVEKDFRASSINISREVEDNISYQNYPLIYLNHSDTLYKYKVQNFEVYSSAVRFYNITQIMRPFDSDVDDAAENNNSISEVPFPVAKQWAFYNVNGDLHVECLDIETITITDKLVGYIHYSNGGIIQGINYPAYTDSHLVAFSTDRQIDELYEADVQWSYCSWRYCYDVSFGDVDGERYSESFGATKVHSLVTLHSESSHVQEHNNLFAHHFQFNEIQSVDDLLAEGNNLEVLYDGAFVKVTGSTNFSSEARASLQSKQWVLRFTTTEYLRTPHQGEGMYWVDRTKIMDVIVLRLKFKTEGVVYNLGVIDNKQTGSNDSLGETKTVYDLSDEMKDIFRILLIILAVFALAFLLKVFMPLFKALWRFITLPFKAIRRLVGKADEKLTEQPQRKPSKYRYRR